LDFRPWRWSALSIIFVAKQPSRMQKQCFFQGWARRVTNFSRVHKFAWRVALAPIWHPRKFLRGCFVFALGRAPWRRYQCCACIFYFMYLEVWVEIPIGKDIERNKTYYPHGHGIKHNHQWRSLSLSLHTHTYISIDKDKICEPIIATSNSTYGFGCWKGLQIVSFS
jgi:hypothetical protein